MRTGKAIWMRLFSRSGWVLTSSNVFSQKFHPVQEILHSESNKRSEEGQFTWVITFRLPMGEERIWRKAGFSYLHHRVSVSEDGHISQSCAHKPIPSKEKPFPHPPRNCACSSACVAP